MNRKSVVAVLACLCIAGAAFSQDIEAILRKNRDSPRPPASKAEMKLIIANKAGQARERKITAWSSTGSGVTKQMLVFEAPADVKGTRFLTVTWDDPAKTDEQAIYIPSFRKIRQIGTSGGDSKTGAFLGSDFSYADLGTLEDSDYQGVLAGKETANGADYWKIAFTARTPDAIRNYGYSKVIRYINAATFTTWRSEYFDASGKSVKKSEIEGFRLVDGKYWQFDRIVMHNLESGGTSTWEFTRTENLDVIDPGYFTLKFLEKGRL